MFPIRERADIETAFINYKNPRHKKTVESIFYFDENKMIGEFTQLITDKGFIQFGSNPKIAGRQNIVRLLTGFNTKFEKMKHSIQRVFLDVDNELVYQAEVNYTFEKGTTTEQIPYVVHLKFEGELISEYKIYIDLSPLYKIIEAS